MWANNSATFNADTVLTGGLYINPSQAISAGCVQGYRLVSSAVHVIPQAAVLNQAGTIHGALVPIIIQPPGIAGGGCAVAVTNTSQITAIANSTYYGTASVSAMEGLRGIWVPADNCSLEFTEINSTPYTGDNTESCNTLVFIIAGAAASTSFRIDTYFNFELTAKSNGILQGMESTTTERAQPTTAWFDVLSKHQGEIIQASRSVGEVAVANMEMSKNDGTVPYRAAKIGGFTATKGNQIAFG